LTGTPRQIGVRWTVGDVSAFGFETLRLSIESLSRLLPPGSQFAVAVNNISVAEAQERTGDITPKVQWLSSDDCVPTWLRAQVDAQMAEGVAWKLAPVRVFPNAYEIALDNDVILWRLPEPVVEWLESIDKNACVMAQDAQRCLGQFSEHCDSRSINSGIRCISPGLDYESLLRETLEKSGVTLRSELDEQGLQATTLAQLSLKLVSNEDVTICSAFPMHQHHLGHCGAHFVGLNQKWLPYIIHGIHAHEANQQNWLRLKDQVVERLTALGPAVSI
jgi:hypothetical protein